MDIGTYVSLAAVAISLAALLRNTQKDGKTDAASAARTQARLEAKMDSQTTIMDDIRVDLRTLRSETSGMAMRVAGIEARLDVLEGKGKE